MTSTDLQHPTRHAWRARHRAHAFLVVNNSPFAFLGYRYLLEQKVPMVGGGFDGNEYGQPGNEKLISILGNIAPVYGAQYHGGLVSLMKKAGAKKVGVVSYGAS